MILEIAGNTIIFFFSRPNRCHGGFQCCPGWQMNPRTMLCTRATCRGPCGFGICRSPNLCQCLMGGFGSNCPGAGSEFFYIYLKWFGRLVVLGSEGGEKNKRVFSVYCNRA